MFIVLYNIERKCLLYWKNIRILGANMIDPLTGIGIATIANSIFTSIISKVIYEKGFPYFFEIYKDTIKDNYLINSIKNILVCTWDQQAMESIKDKIDYKTEKDPVFAEKIRTIFFDYKKDQEFILDDSRRNRDHVRETGALIELGKIYSSYGYNAKAAEMFEEARTLLKNKGNKLSEGIALGNIGLFYQMQKNDDMSQVSYLEAIRTLDDLIGSNNPKSNGEAEISKAHILYNLGNIFAKQDDFDKAITSFEVALKIFQKYNDRSGESKTLINAGNAYSKLNQNERALANYEQSLKSCQETKDLYLENLTQFNKAILYASMNRLAEAHAVFKSILPFFQECGDEEVIKTTHINMGIVSMKLGIFDSSEESFLESISLCKELHDNLGEARVLANLGYIYLNKNMFSRAIKVYEGARMIFQTNACHHDEGIVLKNIGLTYYCQWKTENQDSQLSSAKNYWMKAIAILATNSAERLEVEKWLQALQ
jgi:tetratricopeptide (TPR) repeat protein